MGGKKLVLTILCVLMSINFLISPNHLISNAAVDIAASERIKQELKAKESKLKKALEETKGKIEEKKEYKNNLNLQIENLVKQIRLARSRIKALEKEIFKINNAIKNLEKDIENNMQLLMKRLKSVYMSGDVEFLEILLGAKDFDDFGDKLEIIARMSENDSKLVAEIERQIKELDADKRVAQENKSKAENEKSLLTLKQQELNGLVDETEKILEELKEEKNEEQSHIDETSAEYKKIDIEIKRYYEEQARKKAGNKNPDSTIIPTTGKGFAWPVPGFDRLSSLFNERRGSVSHKGIDIARTNGVSIYGAPVIAAENGVVMMTFNNCVHDYPKLKSCGCGGGYGNSVYIDHGNGKMTIYGHLSNVIVHKGQVVNKGQVIGYVGTTGHSTGPHLHFECRLYGERYDPLSEYR